MSQKDIVARTCKRLLSHGHTGRKEAWEAYYANKKVSESEKKKPAHGYGATSFDQELPWALSDLSGFGGRWGIGMFGGGCKGSIEGHTNDGEGTPDRDSDY